MSENELSPTFLISHNGAPIAVNHEAVLRPAEFEKLVEAVATRVVEKLRTEMDSK
jgi:hypothetical protein